MASYSANFIQVAFLIGDKYFITKERLDALIAVGGVSDSRELSTHPCRDLT